MKKFNVGDIVVLVNHNDRGMNAPIGTKAFVCKEKSHINYNNGEYIEVKWPEGADICQLDGDYAASMFRLLNDKSSNLERKIESMQESIDLMKKALDGEKIEYINHSSDLAWHDLEDVKNHSWDWHNNSYRVKEKCHSYIDWNDVKEVYIYMAKDANGNEYLYKKKPYKNGYNSWSVIDGQYTRADAFKSYKPGDVDWKESLVKRP